VLQCVAVCCNVLQCVAFTMTLQCVAVCCSALHGVVFTMTVQCVAVCYSVLQCVALCCSVLQCVEFTMTVHISAGIRLLNSSQTIYVFLVLQTPVVYVIFCIEITRYIQIYMVLAIHPY